ncbi:metallophosphoesterase family protein [Ilumatobacter nonamiensis]|uniref:metallophosphoesterase family protein n=1 Tax=Ilumatobacter nonamiensis TaxID=467093 RepID=UPI000345CF5C|nr:metallophosphoesterase [Ilumatobacter nonamiensis]
MNEPDGAPIIDVTTVSDTEAVVHVTRPGTFDVAVHRFDGLEADTDHRLDVPAPVGSSYDTDVFAVPVRTLPALTGARLSVLATVNDVHFGELAAGQIDDLEMGPIRRPEPGAEPYPEVMNRGAAHEIDQIDADAVVVKGDLSLDGTDDEFAAFERCYREPFGDRLHVVRGNHDGYRHQSDYAGDQHIDLDGVTIALIDTVIPGATTGDFTIEQADWLDALASVSTQPVFAMGHHQQWIAGPGTDPRDAKRSEDYFGLHPDASDRLDDVCARRNSIVAYAAGHTHRHRLRAMTRSGVPSIEIGCTKDFPGTWAEYRVHDDGIMQVVHRVSSPEALAWSESCRGLYSDFDIDYATYALGTLDDRCFVIPTHR